MVSHHDLSINNSLSYELKYFNPLFKRARIMVWELYQQYHSFRLINEHGQLATGDSMTSPEEARERALEAAAQVKPPVYRPNSPAPPSIDNFI